MRLPLMLAALLAMTLAGCKKSEDQTKLTLPKDHHSYANIEEAKVKHLDLELSVDFDKRQLSGFAQLTVEGSKRIVLDTKGLKIAKVETAASDLQYRPGVFQLGAEDKLLGAPLAIAMPEGTRYVKVTYETSPDATALQWLKPEQTAGKTQPFLYTQGEPIYTRTWIPIQDTPAIRITYKARIKTAPNFFAVMSAPNDQNTAIPTGNYAFDMQQAIPPYLMALAVGELQFRQVGARTGVYTEKAMLDAAGKEFVDLDSMVSAAEQLYGPYRWDRYDVLVCPPGFPIGGMENPRLTFATPTIIAGDRSLVSLLSHELAHSWSGNLVTNATWSDVWLNEGFTVYVERRIQEQLFGKQRSEMEFAIEIAELKEEMKGLAPADQRLHPDMKGRDPEDAFSLVPYIKGALLLRAIEEEVGRETWDKFLRGYFDKFAFQSMSTEGFEAYLKTQLPQLKLNVKEWLDQPGLPASTPKIKSYLLEQVDEQLAVWSRGGKVNTENWTSQQWLHFLRGLPSSLDAAAMAKLDREFHFTATRNAEILDAWLVLAIRHKYAPADAVLSSFLGSVGRQKFLKPLYAEMAKQPEGKAKAKALLAKNKANYHPITAAALEQLLAK